MPKINMDQLLEAVNGLIGEENEEGSNKAVSYTHLTLPTTPYV